MTAVVHDVYEVNLATSGKLKLRAKALLAEGGHEATFDACVLLHEAARLQRLAVRALPVCPPATLLTSTVEECWCYVEGRNPPLAADAWGDVLRARDGVDPATAQSILSRLEPRFKAAQLEFVSVVSSARTLLAIKGADRLAGLTGPVLTRARKELAGVLNKFPGAESFWWLQYRLAEVAENKQEAWAALNRCRQLAPGNPRFLAMSLLIAPWALTAAAADAQLASVRGALGRVEPEVCLMYALAEIALARKGPTSARKQRWTRARNAADAGIARANSEGLRSNLKAVQLLACALLDGREPTVELLYMAGLTELAATARPNANVSEILNARLRQAA